MTSEIITDIAVIGGGHAGLTQTLLFAQAGIETYCIEPNPMPKDDRTTAISYGSMKLLEQAGVWNDLLPFACPIKDIKILDGASPILLDFDAEEISDKIDADAFGWILSNKVIRQTLINHLSKNNSAHIIDGEKVVQFDKNKNNANIHLTNGQIINTKLVIGADGRRSSTREYMKVGAYQWSYNQEAVVCIFQHKNSHSNTAVEHFLPNGPFAVLPMLDSGQGQHQSALVWTQDSHQKPSMMEYSDDVFKIALQEQLPEMYGNVLSVEKRQKYPLGLIHAYDYVIERFALIADAAHGIHPIAGQGLNLGLRDIGSLTKIITAAYRDDQDIGKLDVLKQYDRSRKIDNKSMAAATDLLNHVFSNNSKSIRSIRMLGMKAINKLKPAKRFLMSQAAGVKSN